MRLIDADALCAVSWKRTGDEKYDTGFRHGVGYMADLIEKQSTIDAIPVEWMGKFCADDIAEDQRETIAWMLKVWKREQEGSENEHEKG